MGGGLVPPPYSGAIMTIIVKLSTKPPKAKRKPGHAEREREHREWLAGHGIDKILKKCKNNQVVGIIRSPVVVTTPYRRETEFYPSKGDGVGNATIPAKQQYEGELQAREEAAQKITEYMKTCVAPICNKSGYTYVTPGMDPTTLGRKV